MNPPNASFDTEVCAYDAAGIAKAAALIARGLPVAVPTETVYGLAADATNNAAVAAIYAAKGRPAFNPLIVHVEGLAQAGRIARVDAVARQLAEIFWPGPLTMVLPLATDSPVAPLVTAGLATVAVRAPSHPAMRALLAACGTPLAAPSANASGRTSPTRAAHVLRSLAGRIPLVLDAGPTMLGLESTIVAPTPDGLRLLRPGPLTAARLAEASGLPVTRGGGGAITSPGQMASHYAPIKPLRLNATEARDGEWLIGFGPVRGDVTLSATGDPSEAAARLFALLYEADYAPGAAIAIAPIPLDGLGAALNDRLRRAAAPH